MYFKSFFILILTGIVIFSYSCKKPVNPAPVTKLSDVKVKVTFTPQKTSRAILTAMTKQTPDEYGIALKKVVLIGKNGTPDFPLFNQNNLSSSYTFDFKDKNTLHSLLKGASIPNGEYQSIKIFIYYLQMKIPISTTNRGVGKRNIRIYLSDDAETENGQHQPGDMTQINSTGTELGWMLGEGQLPDMDPIKPRINAYTYGGNGVSWYNFAGKSGKDFGPFGDTAFFNHAPHPVFYTKADFNFVQNSGTTLVVDLNINNCWQFEDRNGDGNFGPQDIGDTVNPTKWHMELPKLTVGQQ